MSRTVTALYSTREEADLACRALCSEVSLDHAEIYDNSPERVQALEQLDLDEEERASCQRALASGDYMLLARVHRGEDPDHIVNVLERIAAEPGGRQSFGGNAGAGPSAETELMLGQGGEAGASLSAGNATVAEERIPIVEEELRVGTREVVRGGARVRTRVEEIPVQQEVELIEEHASVERRPATRQVSEAELEQGGLLRERVIEIAQIREEAVVTKEAFVREEVVVTKSLERRVEQITDTIRRTEVEADRIGADGERSAFGSLNDGSSDTYR
jgi:hypothetical protein